MFLNDIGHPLILNPNKKYGPYEQFNGPLLVSETTFKEHVLPNNWCNTIIGSKDGLNKLRNNPSLPAYTKENVAFHTLSPNVPTLVGFVQSTLLVTLIPAGRSSNGEEANYYLISNKYVKALITDNLGEFLDFLPRSCEYFQRALSNTIDVMYINDAIYSGAGEEVFKTPKHEQIYELVQLIRPKHLYGLMDTELPKCLKDLCVQEIYIR